MTPLDCEQTCLYCTHCRALRLFRRYPLGASRRWFCLTCFHDYACRRR